MNLPTRCCFLLGCLAACFSVEGHAAPILVDFVRAELPPDSTTTSLPYFLGPDTNIIFLKFKIPDFSSISVINSFVVNVTLYDDDDGGGEVGKIQFAQPAGNVMLNGFTTLNHITVSSPLTITTSMSSEQIGQIFPSIADGNFRIRVSRDSGDFYLAGGSASIDATLIPEPASVSVVASGLLAVGWLLRRRARKLSTR